MALGNGVWRLLDHLGVVGTGMGGISVWGRWGGACGGVWVGVGWATCGGGGGGGGGGAGRSGMFRKTIVQACSHIFCMGTNVFLTFFLKEKKTTSTLRTLLCLKLVEIGPLSTLIFVLCQRVPTKK